MTSETKCSVCRSGERQAVTAALASGKSIRSVAAEFNLNRNAVHAHSRHAALESGGPADRPDVRVLLRTAQRLLQRAEKASDLQAALRSLDRVVELQKLVSVEPVPVPGGPVEIHVTYDDPGHPCSKLTPEARRAYLAQLVLNELAPERTPENVLAGGALVVSFLRREQLPPEIAEEVRKILEAEKEQSHGAL